MVVYVWLGIFITDEIREIYLQPASLLSQKVQHYSQRKVETPCYYHIFPCNPSVAPCARIDLLSP